jgi:hypothetical protein
MTSVPAFSTPVLVLCFLAATYVFFSFLLRLTQDAKEPPALGTSIPFVSPILGMVFGMQEFTVK